MILTILVILNTAAIIALCYYCYRYIRLYEKLTEGTTEKTLSESLTRVLNDVEKAKKQVADITKKHESLKKDIQFYPQKIGLIRFNPFADTGGDQSFILTILNGQDDGILISSLHGRAHTRWYAKAIKNGHGVERELTHEEKTAVANAKILI